MLRTAPPLHVSAMEVGTIILPEICAAHESLRGPSRHFAATQQTVADEPAADIAPPTESRIYQRGVGATPSFFCRLDDDVVY
jgi:hypothetical protein